MRMTQETAANVLAKDIASTLNQYVGRIASPETEADIKDSLQRMLNHSSLVPSLSYEHIEVAGMDYDPAAKMATVMLRSKDAIGARLLRELGA